jgi:hypothetical protein
LLQVGLQVDDVPAKPLAQVVDGVLGRVLLGVELEDSVGTNQTTESRVETNNIFEFAIVSQK